MIIDSEGYPEVFFTYRPVGDREDKGDDDEYADVVYEERLHPRVVWLGE